MTTETTLRERTNRLPDYGLDAPGLRDGMLLGGAAGMTIALAGRFAFAGNARIAISGVGIVAAGYGFGMGAYMTYASRVGKIRTRERILARVGARRAWRGDETVLDIGCGRGLMAVGAARRLTTGSVIGIDVWRVEDQSASAEAALANAALEGVAARMRVETADARAIPLADASVDVVLSHWVLHNIATQKDRQRALGEIWRVLRPGGVVAIADIEHVPAYAAALSVFGASDFAIDDGGIEAAVMRFLSGGSYCPQSVIATKPTRR